MIKDDIISMARETRVYDQEWRYNMREEQEALEAFYHLAVAAERAKVTKESQDAKSNEANS